MKKDKVETSRNRRNFLKAASGAAMALAAVNDTFAQSPDSKPAPRKESRASEPRDRGLWITWYDLPEEGREAYVTWLHGCLLYTSPSPRD